MSSRVLLRGGHRSHPAGSVVVGEPNPKEIVQITLILNRRDSAPEPDRISRQLTRAELRDLHGADPADIRAVEEFASANHLAIARLNPAARTITLCGPLSIIAGAFGADLALSEIEGKILRTREGSLYVPDSLRGRVMAVMGFDQRPIAKPYHRFHPRSSASVAYTPRQVAQLYSFPTNTGANQTIALIELGGGFQNSDLQTYWSQLDLPDVSTTAVSVDGAQNSPTGDPNTADGEVVLDIEVAGGVAPGARLAVYFAPNTDQGFFDAINAAIHDEARNPSVISISWGGAEPEWTPQAMNAFNAAFHDAALLGISVCVASGDNGSFDGEPDGNAHVDFPASSPWVLSCGGTTLEAQNGKILSETVWNDSTSGGGATGGGVSSHFSRPAYQAKVNVPPPQATVNPTGRGVPDVAGVADPYTGYTIIVDGMEGVVGGTSAVAPLWAGLIALFNESLGKNLGWFHRSLYGTLAQHKALNDITSGSNGTYEAAKGWDPCTGLGSPNGQAILKILQQLPKK
ncbi:MAG: S8/S53 family peptidase [Acidobacteriaceae bacterium]|nr:S8/S53 family peptidase [Acidobacteriaceae bacterium]MBV9778816.1 S8/S53 family peptidase [Acidobacteriaceae bacterium]